MKMVAENPDEEYWTEGWFLNLEKQLREGGTPARQSRRVAMERGTEDENDEQSRLQKELRRIAIGKSLAGNQRLDGGARPARRTTDAPWVARRKAEHSNQQSTRIFRGGFFPGEDSPWRWEEWALSFLPGMELDSGSHFNPPFAARVPSRL